MLKLARQPKTGSGDDHTCVALRGNAATGRRDLGEVRRVALRQRVARGHLFLRHLAHNVDVGRLDAKTGID